MDPGTKFTAADHANVTFEVDGDRSTEPHRLQRAGPRSGPRMVTSELATS
jgi:hypothetical protein